MVMPISPQILQGIANPPIGDFATGFRQNVEEKAFNEETAEVLKNTVGSKYADLIKIDPARGFAVAEAVGALETQDEALKAARMKHTVGLLSLANDLVKTGKVSPEELGQFELEQAKILAVRGIPVDFMIDSGTKLINGTPEEQQAEMAAFGELVAGFGGEDKNLLEIRKETRKSVRDQLKDVSKQAGVITTNFNKITGLIEEVSKGNRTATSQALVAIVKLGDPGSVVKLEEMVGALNTQNPIAAITDLLRGQGHSENVINSVTATIDPLNPRVLKVDDLLNTANKLVSANAPVIQESFGIARENAETLSESGRRSLFTKGLTKRVAALSQLVSPSTPIVDKPIAEMTIEELQAERAKLSAN